MQIVMGSWLDPPCEFEVKSGWRKPGDFDEARLLHIGRRRRACSAGSSGGRADSGRMNMAAGAQSGPRRRLCGPVVLRCDGSHAQKRVHQAGTVTATLCRRPLSHDETVRGATSRSCIGLLNCLAFALSISQRRCRRSSTSRRSGRRLHWLALQGSGSGVAVGDQRRGSRGGR